MFGHLASVLNGAIRPSRRQMAVDGIKWSYPVFYETRPAVRHKGLYPRRPV